MIKTNIKMRVTPEQNAKVQEICFDKGFKCLNGNRYTYTRYLFLYRDIKIIRQSDNSEHYYEDDSFKEINPELFIRTNGTCKYFKYPMWFKSKKWGYVVKFTDLRHGIVVKEGIHPTIDSDFSSSMWTPHTDSATWEQVENPNEHLDRLNDIVEEAIEEVAREVYRNAHYKAQKIDTIARCKANMALEQQKAICIFQIDRYTHREKGQNLSDIQKIRDYLDWLEDIEIELSNKGRE